MTDDEPKNPAIPPWRKVSADLGEMIMGSMLVAGLDVDQAAEIMAGDRRNRRELRRLREMILRFKARECVPPDETDLPAIRRLYDHAMKIAGTGDPDSQ